MYTIYVSCVLFAEQSVKFCVQYIIFPSPCLHLSLFPFPFFPLFLPSLVPLSPSLHSILSFLARGKGNSQTQVYLILESRL